MLFPAMATRLTYTTGARSPELDRAFESALAEVREREPEPLAHLVGGRDRAGGTSGLTGKGGLGPYYVQQFAREQSRTIVEQ
jgi:hypothetical protein